MKPRLTPIDIPLRDLPPEGREFTYTRDSGELEPALKELVGGNDYHVRFHITPVGNAYDMRGEVLTSLDLQCALCAMDLKFPVKTKLHELLVVQKPLEKGDHLTKANHAHEWEDKGPDCILLESEHFQVADYIHEVVALAEPIRPLGKPDCDTSCENMTDSVKKWLRGGDPMNADPIKARPFQVLEKLKLKS